MALNMFFLPYFGSNSLEVNNRGFQQVPLPQPQESKTESAAPLAMTLLNPRQISDLLRWARCLSVLQSQSPSSKDLLGCGAKPAALSPGPSSVPGALR